MRVLCCIITVLSGACSVPTTPPPPSPAARTFGPADAPTPAPATAQLTLAESDAGLSTHRDALSVDFEQLRDLWIRIETPSLAHLTTATLYFHLPNGELFKTVSRVFSTNPAVTELPASPVPITVLPARANDTTWQLDFALPMAGSAFTRQRHLGTWIVRAALSGRTDEQTVQLVWTPGAGGPQ